MEGGREGLILKLHHSYTDGLGAVKLALELFDPSARLRPTRLQCRTCPGSRVAPPSGVCGTTWPTREGGPPAGAPRRCALGRCDGARRGPGPLDASRVGRGHAGFAALLGPPGLGTRQSHHGRPFGGGLVGGHRADPRRRPPGRPAGRGERQRPVPAPAARRAGPVSRQVRSGRPHAAGGDPGQHPAGRRPGHAQPVRRPHRPRPAEPRRPGRAGPARPPDRPPRPEPARIGSAGPGPGGRAARSGGPGLLAAGLRSMDLLASNLPGPPVPLFLAGARWSGSSRSARGRGRPST